MPVFELANDGLLCSTDLVEPCKFIGVLYELGVPWSVDSSCGVENGVPVFESDDGLLRGTLAVLCKLLGVPNELGVPLEPLRKLVVPFPL